MSFASIFAIIDSLIQRLVQYLDVLFACPLTTLGPHQKFGMEFHWKTSEQIQRCSSWLSAQRLALLQRSAHPNQCSGEASEFPWIFGKHIFPSSSKEQQANHLSPVQDEKYGLNTGSHQDVKHSGLTLQYISYLMRISLC